MSPKILAIQLRDRCLEYAVTIAETISPNRYSFGANIDSEDEIVILWPQRKQWIYSAAWLASLIDALGKMCRVVYMEIPQLGSDKWTVTFGIKAHNVQATMCVDVRDTNEIDSTLLDKVDLYFKLQYRSEGYDSTLVIPGGYSMPRVSNYLHLPGLRRLSAKKQYHYDIYGRFGVYHRGHDHNRLKAYKILEESDLNNVSPFFERVPYRKYMQEMAGSKICIDIPGNGYFCFRLIEYMSIGAFIVSPRHENRLPVPLKDGENIVFVKDDYSDLVSTCEYYLEHEDERERIKSNCMAYFDQHLNRYSLGAWYLKNIRDKMAQKVPLA